MCFPLGSFDLTRRCPNFKLISQVLAALWLNAGRNLWWYQITATVFERVKLDFSFLAARGRKSLIWNYYHIVADGAICKECGKNLRGHWTTNAVSHLARHKEAYKEFLLLKKQFLSPYPILSSTAPLGFDSSVG